MHCLTVSKARWQANIGFPASWRETRIFQSEHQKSRQSHEPEVSTDRLLGKLFDVLEKIFEEHPFPPTNIYNVDETGMTTIQNKPSQMLALKGRHQVGAITSAERGQLVTMRATGSYIPPLFIFSRSRMKAELMDGAPNGSIFACHKSGWIPTEIFTQWFEHLVRLSGARKDNQVLLILDGHSTPTTNIDVINNVSSHLSPAVSSHLTWHS